MSDELRFCFKECCHFVNGSSQGYVAQAFPATFAGKA